MTTAQATAAKETAIPAGTWRSDSVHSHIDFTVKHAGVSTFRGGFEEFEAVLENEDGEPRLRGRVRVDSVDVRDENLNGHLLSPDFFDAERHPELSFNSTGIRLEGDDLIVDGDLTIKGTTRAVEARGQLTGPVDISAGERIGIDLQSALDRTEFGVDWNAELPDGRVMVENEVTVTVHLELAKEE